MLQGGDCAESFDGLYRTGRWSIELKILLQMGLCWLRRQETGRSGGRIPGSMPNRDQPDARRGRRSRCLPIAATSQPASLHDDYRIPDPNCSCAVTNARRSRSTIRALAGRGGFADLHHPENTGHLDFVRHWPRLATEYSNRSLIVDFSTALRFLRERRRAARCMRRRSGWICLLEPRSTCTSRMSRPITRFIGDRQRWYNLSTHIPWIGLEQRRRWRTRRALSGHVEPDGVKVGRVG